MGWVKENLATDTGKVEGLVISETADDRIRYALLCVPDIKLKICKRKGESFEFKQPEEAYFLADYIKLSDYQREKLIKELLQEKIENEGE